MIVRFGRAALVRRADGKCQLKGGSRDDLTTAKEWISLFMHEVVLSGSAIGDGHRSHRRNAVDFARTGPRGPANERVPMNLKTIVD